MADPPRPAVGRPTRPGPARPVRLARGCALAALAVLLCLPVTPLSSDPVRALPPVAGPAKVAGHSLTTFEATSPRAAVAPAPTAKAFPEAPGWRSVSTPVHPSGRWGSAAAFDPATGAIVLFGGAAPTGYLNDTWTFSGAVDAGSWQQLTAPHGPSPRAFAAMAYDPAFGGLVLFGGSNAGGPLGDTWLLANGTWKELSTTGPSARYGAGLAYDPVSGALTLFGGRDRAGFDADTWTFTPSGWQEEFPVDSPTARASAVLDFDPARGTVVLQGGIGASGAFLDTEDWNGTDWSADASAGNTSRLSGAAGAYSDVDGVLVAAGGNVSATPTNTTLELAATGAWTSPHLEGTLPPRSEAAAAYSPGIGAVVLFGGWNGTALSDTWEFSTGTPVASWREVNGTASPSPRIDAATVYDPADAALLLFGGEDRQANPDGAAPDVASDVYNDTWLWRDGSWTELHPAIAPSPRWGAMIAYDPIDGYVVLFGGSAVGTGNKTVYLNDTWTFRAGVWTERNEPTAPAARRGGGFAFDPVDGYLVLYGGHNGSTPATYTYDGDTWAFVGGTWSRLHPTGRAPPPLSQPQFAYDPTSGYLVLNGGFRGDATSGQPTAVPYTYSLVDDRWTNLSGLLGADAPAARAAGAFVEDPSAGGLALFGGNNDTTTLSDVWIFRAGAFTELCANCSPKLHATGQLAFDPADGSIVAFGQPVGANATAETWIYLPTLTASVTATPSATDLGFATRVAAIVGGGVAPLSGRWAFDDGTVVPGFVADHTFATTGNHTATFTLTDAYGNTSVHVLTIAVHDAPLANLSVSPWGPGNQTARLAVTMDGGAPPFVYTYTFGDGTNLTTSSAVVYHHYATSGRFAATVAVVDADGENSTSSAIGISMPATLPSVTLTASAWARASPASVLLDAVANDPYGGLHYAWSANSTPAANVTHYGLKSTNATAVLNLPRPLSANATVFLWVNVSDADNFTAGAHASVAILPAFAGAIAVTILGEIGCPVRVNSTAVGLAQNVTGGAAPYTFSWDVAGSNQTGANVTVDLTPGATVPVALTVLDSVGDNFTVLRTVLVPAATCPPSTSLPSARLLLVAGAGAILALVIVLEGIHLYRRRHPPPARGPPAPASPPTDDAPPGAP